MKKILFILIILYSTFNYTQNKEKIREVKLIKQTTEYKEWHSSLLAYVLFNNKKFDLTLTKSLNKSTYYYILNELTDNKIEKSNIFNKKLSTYKIQFSPLEIETIFIKPIIQEASNKFKDS
ncbi:hypothetical protein [Cellulophaga omnivescoria]|uniref:hypothetical protein n=1 Tax=Cellulophaga omnivescoria TaxID=1888890 RepID=UPI003EBFF030